MARAAAPLCTVRGCGLALSLGEARATCPQGHTFDRARAGYWNLLQPQDRRSRAPGDPAPAAQARRRLFAAGHDAPLTDALVALLREARVGGGVRLLDVGCGEGSLTWAVASAMGTAASVHGIDISVPSVAMAARAWPSGCWVVANADRGLPWADGTFDVVLSVNGRLPAAEIARVLAPGGVAAVAVPGPADVAELRALLRGSATPRDVSLSARLAPALAVRATRRLRFEVVLDPAGVEDLLAAGYRGARASEQAGRRSALASERALRITREQDLALASRPA